MVSCRYWRGVLTSGLGSSDHAARVATGELANRGWPRLASLVGGQIASFGDSCWITDARLGESIRRPDGRCYHPESIARVRRQLRDAKIIESTRVFPNGELPTQAKYRHSSHGTTIKKFVWGAIAQKNPFTRRARKLRRIEQAQKAREAGDVVKAAPQYTSARAIAYQPPPKPVPRTTYTEEIARLAAEAQAAQARNAEREAARRNAALAARAEQSRIDTPDPHPPPE